MNPAFLQISDTKPTREEKLDSEGNQLHENGQPTYVCRGWKFNVLICPYAEIAHFSGAHSCITGEPCACAPVSQWCRDDAHEEVLS
jgi:hypothetical protein